MRLANGLGLFHGGTGVAFALLLGLYAIVVPVSCAPELTVPQNAQLECERDSDCPSGYSCRQNVKLCSKGGGSGDDLDPPKVVKESIEIRPTAAKKGTIINLQFEVNEELTAAPEVRLNTPGAKPFKLATEDGQRYRYTYTADGDESEKQVSIVATMTDKRGNEATDVLVGNVTFDFHFPTMTNAVVDPESGFVAVDKEMGYSVTFSETPKAVDITTDPPLDLDLAEADGNNYSWTHKAVKADEETTYTVTIATEDEAGNVGENQTKLDTGNPLPRFTFDFTPPALDSKEVRVLPASGTLPVDVKRVNTGAKVELEFRTSERLPRNYEPEVFAEPGSLSFEKYLDANPDYTYRFAHDGNGVQEGDYRIFVRLKDETGNISDALDAGTFTVDDTPPEKPDTAPEGSFRLHRAPMGARDDASEYDPKSWLEVGKDVTLDASSLFVWDETKTRQLGEVVDFESGAATTIDLKDADRTAVYVSVVDDAGNESDRVKVQHVRYHTRVTGPGDNRNGLGFAVPYGPVFPHLRPGDPDAKVVFSATVANLDSVAKQDGSPFVVSGSQAPWRKRSPDGAKPARPGARAAGTLVFDPRRAGMILFGGQGQDLALQNDTWLWDGSNWEEIVTTNAPSPRWGHAATYDSKRGRIVLFGGQGVNQKGDPDTLNDLWEFDGADWYEVEPQSVSPAKRYGHGFVYDPVNDKSVMFGGDDLNETKSDTWIWDGTAWTEQDKLMVFPSERGGCGMIFSDDLKRAVLFGGAKRAGTYKVPYNDMWVWDGMTWTQVAPDNPLALPTQRAAVGFTYDSARKRVVMIGGSALDIDPPPLQETWEWNGTVWTKIAAKDQPSARYVPNTTAYDPLRRRVVVFGGAPSIENAKNPFDDTYEYRLEETAGAEWRDVFASGASGPELRDSTLTYLPDTKKTVLFGGARLDDLVAFNDTWTWDGVWWTRESPATSPDPAFYASAEYDRKNARIVVYGGQGSDKVRFKKTWAYDGVDWTPLDLGPDPMTTMEKDACLADNALMGRLFLFGGMFLDSSSNKRETDELWWFDGSPWKLLSVAIPPTPEARAEHACVYDKKSKKMLVFGGKKGGDADTLLGDTWVLVPDRWESPPVTMSPSPRRHARMAYDDARCVSLLAGGKGSGSSISSETWEWSNDDWHQLDPAVPPAPVLGFGLAYDADRTAFTYHGGYNGILLSGDTWTWSPVAARPFAIFSFSFAGMDVPKYSDGAGGSFRRLSVHYSAGGVSHDNGTMNCDGKEVKGFQVYAWAPALAPWVPLLENTTATPDALEPGDAEFPASSWSCTELPQWTKPEMVDPARKYCKGATPDQWVDSEKLFIMLSTRTPTGASSVNAELAVDYLEVDVDYWIPD
ncbi:MAG: hypothetical protein HY897_16520 [Deltaproteobacteria bacterium]|nr:hypothetical protein [Deltaproteobacteria bacterium]